MKKETRNILIILGIALIARILFSFSFFVHWWDESVYLSLAYDLSHHFFHYTLAGANWSDYIPFGHFPYSWPNIGFRAPLFPYALSILYFLKLNFLVPFFNPIVGALSTVAIYFLGKELFSKKVGIYSSLIFALLPFNLFNNSMVMTGTLSTFFVILTFLFFWKGFEKGENKYKIFFGISLALALLARYTVLWIIPVFLIYFLIRDKNFKFLKDKYLWYSIIAFFVLMTPWFIYGQHFYGNILGGFIHGVQAASYWGGTESLLFYFKNSWAIFSAAGIAFLGSLIYFFKKKEFSKKQIYLLLVWAAFFFIVSCLVGHKENRFLLPMVPAVIILSGYFLSKLKKRSKLILALILAVLIIHSGFLFVSNYKANHTGTNYCFNKMTEFVKTLPKNSLIFTDETPIVYAYTHQRTRYYPNPWSIKSLESSVNSTNDLNDSYVIYTDMDKPLYNKQNAKFKNDLDSSFEKIFNCDYNWGLSSVYKISTSPAQ